MNFSLSWLRLRSHQSARRVSLSHHDSSSLHDEELSLVRRVDRIDDTEPDEGIGVGVVKDKGLKLEENVGT